MLAPSSIERIDQLLNELEDAARTQVSSSQFFAHLVDRLLYLTGASSVAFLIPADQQNWLPLAQAGEDARSEDASAAIQAFSSLTKTPAVRTRDMLSGKVAQHSWYAIPLRPAQFDKGCLLVSLSKQPKPEAQTSLLELVSAFAEIASLRQLADIERFLDQRWQALQTACVEVANSASVNDAGVVLVNQLVPVLSAARVSLAQSGLLHGIRVANVSGVPDVDHRLATTLALRDLAAKAIKARRPIIARQPHESNADGQKLSEVNEDGLFQNHLAVQLTSPMGKGGPQNVLLIEWRTCDAMLSATPVLSHVLPLVSSAWHQHRRWLRVPRFIRQLCGIDLTGLSWARQTIRWAVIVGLMILAAFLLTRPYPMTIEARAILEPITQRTVFADMDGHIEQLLVEDGQHLEAGQVVAKMRSPVLDLQMEEIRGKQKSLGERRSALRAALTQIDPASREAAVTKGRLSAEIAQIDVEDENLEKQLELLAVEAKKLNILAPIAGTVIARDLKQQLDRRPLRRGDALFAIADLSGNWQLKIDVADKDSHYVLQSVGSAFEHPDVEFVLDSLPEEKFTTHLYRKSNTLTNVTGQGCFLQLRGTVQRDVVERSHMGAGAHVYFDCGRKPVWFVWCRPLIEAAQRRLWIKSE